MYIHTHTHTDTHVDKTQTTGRQAMFSSCVSSPRLSHSLSLTRSISFSLAHSLPSFAPVIIRPPTGYGKRSEGFGRLDSTNLCQYVSDDGRTS